MTDPNLHESYASMMEAEQREAGMTDAQVACGINTGHEMKDGKCALCFWEELW